MNLQHLQLCWHQLGQTTAMESVFSPPRMRGKKWASEAFFASGQQEVERVISHLQRLGLTLPGGQALDFGCGIGRVTQALVPYFETCHGVDIAPSMLELAQQYNRYGEKCRYHLNQRDDLQLFADNSLNFVYSMITLQNLEPRYSKKYIREFARILAPGGLLLFQIPSHPKTLRESVKKWLPEPLRDLIYFLKYRGTPHIELHGVKQSTVIKLLESQGIKLLDIQSDNGAYHHWASFRYYGVKL